MKEDNLGFPTGIMVVVFVYAGAFAIYNWGYGKGKDASKCSQRHGYEFSRVRAAFTEVRK